MDCRQCAEDLTAFLDGELSKADSERVRSHVDTCISCSEELRSLLETADFVESHNRKIEPRIETWNLIRARIAAEAASASRSWIPIRWRWQTAAAALVIMAAGTFGYMQYQEGERRNLDEYIARYVREREARMVQHALTVSDSQIVNPYRDNPFIEIKATVADNPFRSEDR